MKRQHAAAFLTHLENTATSNMFQPPLPDRRHRFKHMPSISEKFEWKCGGSLRHRRDTWLQHHGTSTVTTFCDTARMVDFQSVSTPVPSVHAELVRDVSAPDATLCKRIDPPDMFQQHIEHRCGHFNNVKVNARLKLEGKSPISSTKHHRCAICLLAKMRRRNISKGSREHPKSVPAALCPNCKTVQAKAERFSTRPGQSVSVDLAGPFVTPTIGGSRYACIFVDHYSRYTWVDLIASKSATNCLRSLQKWCQHTGTRPDHVHSDCGREFLGVFSEWLREHTVSQTFTCPYSSFANSIVERRVRSCKEAAPRRNRQIRLLFLMCTMNLTAGQHLKMVFIQRTIWTWHVALAAVHVPNSVRRMRELWA